jgi:NADH:ubiquinone oxidoreductase subunit 6 (subunit J)
MTGSNIARAGIVVFFVAFIGALATPKSATAWLRYTEASVLVGLPLLAVLTLVIAVIRTRDYRATVREVPPSNGIQVLDTVLRSGEDDDR